MEEERGGFSWLLAIVAIAIWAIFMFWINSPAHTRDLTGQFSQLPDEDRLWLRSRKVPGGPTKGSLCCNEADGTYAEEDIINGRYWARWRIEGAMTAWMPVPPDALLDTPNRNGAPVVWWFYNNGIPVIRCFAPGGGV